MDKDDSVLALTKEMLELAKKNMSNDGFLAKVALLFAPKELLIAKLEFAAENKESFFTQLGKTCKEEKCNKIIMVNDVAMRTHDKPQEMKYVLNNYDTESPLTYPVGTGGRQEAIMIYGLDFTTMKSNVIIQIYHKVVDVVVYDNLIETDQAIGNIEYCIVKGYRSKKK